MENMVHMMERHNSEVIRTQRKLLDRKIEEVCNIFLINNDLKGFKHLVMCLLTLKQVLK